MPWISRALTRALQEASLRKHTGGFEEHIAQLVSPLQARAFPPACRGLSAVSASDAVEASASCVHRVAVMQSMAIELTLQCALLTCAGRRDVQDLSQSQPGKLTVALILERLPVVTPEPPPWAVEHHTWLSELDNRKRAEKPRHWIDTEKEVDEVSSARQWQAADRITDADRSHDTKSLWRCLDQRLYFVIGGTGGPSEYKRCFQWAACNALPGRVAILSGMQTWGPRTSSVLSPAGWRSIRAAASQGRASDRPGSQCLTCLMFAAGQPFSFPERQHTPGETMRAAAERVLQECAQPEGTLQTYFLGNGPICHWSRAESPVFFHKAQLIRGSLTPATSSLDYAWLSKAEMLAQTTDDVLRELFDKVL
ncbi:hypothetical protein MMC07_002601 [Pseudocyphellaria aurata]|nr:hypothetical protein [Pseudocyphellaria aurata]